MNLNDDYLLSIGGVIVMGIIVTFLLLSILDKYL